MAASRDVEALLKSSVYGSREELLDDAFRALLELKPGLRTELAVELYRERKVTLWRAAEIAGVGLEEFKEILSSRNIEISVGGETEESEERLDRILPP